VMVQTLGGAWGAHKSRRSTAKMTRIKRTTMTMYKMLIRPPPWGVATGRSSRASPFPAS
jgi:hypothetical protein